MGTQRRGRSALSALLIGAAALAGAGAVALDRSRSDAVLALGALGIAVAMLCVAGVLASPLGFTVPLVHRFRVDTEGLTSTRWSRLRSERRARRVPSAVLDQIPTSATGAPAVSDAAKRSDDPLAPDEVEPAS